jgi:hypothetical protein
MLAVEPIAGDGRGAVGVVLVIGGDDFDRLRPRCPCR